MRTSPMLEFPVEEFAQRIGRLTQSLKSAGLDGIMLTSKENTRYFSGLQSIIWSSKVSTPGILFVSADGNARMVGSASASETARYTGCVDDQYVTHFDRNGIPGIPSTYPDALIAAVRDLGLDHGKIGMELGGGCYFSLQLHWFDQVLAGLDICPVDASDLVLAVRSRKSSAEIAVLREAHRMSTEGLRFAFSHTELGRTTEAEFYRLYAQEAFHQGCENILPMSVRFGAERAPYTDCPYREDVIIQDVPHAVLQVAGGLLQHGYYAKATGTGVVRALNDEQKRLTEACAQVHQYALEQLRPGIPVSQIIRQIDAFAAEKNTNYLGCVGDGIGLDIQEYPHLAKMDQETLTPGMVLTFGVRFGNEEAGVFCSQEPVVVGEDKSSGLAAENQGPYILA